MIGRVGWAALTIAAGAACSPVYVARAPVPASVPALDPPAAREAPSSELASILATLVWPLAVDRTAVVSSAYGPRERLGGGSRHHQGLDLRAREGTPIHAVADGRIVRSGVGGAYGNVVVIDHGAGLASLYGHNRENLVREGDRVRRGQVVALVGRTGNATGDHLHFELRWRGGTVDPRVALPRLGGEAGR